MPDIEAGVEGSTTDESADLALLNTEESEVEDSEETKEGEERKDERVSKPRGKEEKSERDDEDEEPEEGDDDKEGADEDKTRPPFDRPTMQELKKEFPDIFKKFPSLRDMYYREQEFSQIFPTVEDAQTASVNSEAYDNLSSKILSGRSEELFNAIKEADDKAFVKMADSILPTLYKMSPDIHWKVLQPTMHNLVRGFYIEGEKRQNDNIKNAAEYLSDFIFGDIKFATENRQQQKPVEESEEAKQLKKDREEFESNRYSAFFMTVKSGVDSEMQSLINSKNAVDPDKIFSPFIRDTIIGKVRSEVDKQLAADKAHMKLMQSLWNKAKNEGYGDEWKSRIQSAYLARAKSLIPSIRAKFVAEASGSSLKASDKKRESVERTSSRREPGTGGRTSREQNGPVDPKRVDWGKTSDLDLLNGNISYKR